MTIYGRRTAARAIQKHWRSRRKPKKMKVSKVKSIVRGMEPTRQDLWSLTDTIGTTPLILNNLTNMSYNEDSSIFGTRQSTKVSLMSFRFRGNVEVDSAATDNHLRLLIVRKTAQDGAPFDARKCFLSHPGFTINYLQSQINKRYCSVVWEREFLLQNSDPSLLTNERYPTVVWKRILDIVYKFPKGAVARYPLVANATAVQPINHQYYFIAVSDSAVLSPAIQGQACLFFKNA